MDKEYKCRCDHCVRGRTWKEIINKQEDQRDKDFLTLYTNALLNAQEGESFERAKNESFYTFLKEKDLINDFAEWREKNHRI